MDVWFPLNNPIKPKILFCAWQDLLIHCYNQYQNHRNHPFHWKDKCEKPNISYFNGRYESWHKYTAKRGYIEIVCHKVYENFYKDNLFLHITCQKCLDKSSKKISSTSMESTTYKTMELQWAQRQQFWFLCQYFHDIIETTTLSNTVSRRTVWKCCIHDIFSLWDISKPDIEAFTSKLTSPNYWIHGRYILTLRLHF